MYTFILQKEPDEKGQWSVIKIRCPSTMGVRAGGGTQYVPAIITRTKIRLDFNNCRDGGFKAQL